MKFRTLGAVGYLAEGVLLIASALVFVFTYFFTKTVPAQVPPSANPSPLPGLAFAGVGEALTFLPLALVSFAWLYAGKEGKSGIIRATGMLGFILIASVVAFSVWFFGTVSTLFPPSTASPTSASFGNFFGVVFGFLIGGAVVGLLALAYVILEIVTLFSAAGVFHSARFRWAAWGRIISIIAVVALYFAAFAFLISSIIPTVGPFNSTNPVVLPSQQFTSQAGLTFAALFVSIPLVLSVPNFLAFQGFRRIKLEAPPPPPQTWSRESAPVVDGT